MFSSDVLTVEKDGSIAVVWLDSPERRNAMGSAFWSDLPAAMDEVGSDPEVRCVIVAARGTCFTVGLDLKDAFTTQAAAPSSVASPASQSIARHREIRRLQDSITSVYSCPKPTIAAVHGYCLGGGVDLITACDIRLAAANATFSVRETRIAIVADLGTLQRLPRIVGPGHAAELIYTGADIDAARAGEIGLVNHIYADHDELLRAARELAGQIAANSPLSVAGSKAVLRASEGRPDQDGLAYVAAWNAGMLVSDDLAEAMGAFLEKRAPGFTGA